MTQYKHGHRQGAEVESNRNFTLLRGDTMRDTLLKFFEAYTTLARQLFEAWADAYQAVRPPEYDCDENNYEWLYDAPRYISGNCDELIMLFGKQWYWHFHGAHCQFRCLDSVDKTKVEANFYNCNIVDSGFFAWFLETYPPAIKEVKGIEIDFNTITNLLETYAKEGFLHQIEERGVNFIRVSA